MYLPFTSVYPASVHRWKGFYLGKLIVYMNGACPNVNIHVLKEYKTSKNKNILKYHHFEALCQQ